MLICAPEQPALIPAIHAAYEDWPRALADQQEIVRLAEPFPSPGELAHMAELSVLAEVTGEEQQAICTRAVSLAAQSGARKALAVALRARSRMYLAQERWERAEQDLRQALETFKAMDLPWEQGQTLACLSQFHQRRAARQPEVGTHHLGLARLFREQALGFFESLHAVHDARRIREEMAEESEAVK